MLNAEPVVKSQSSDAMNSAIRATWSTVPRRPRGTRIDPRHHALEPHAFDDGYLNRPNQRRTSTIRTTKHDATPAMTQ